MAYVSKILEKIKFSLFSPEMTRKMSAAKTIVPDTYDDDGYPIDGGLVDTALGVVDPGLRCKTCGGRVKECPGHFGHIELVRPVVHVSFGKQITYVLKNTCHNCHRILRKPTAEEKAAAAALAKTETAAGDVPSLLEPEKEEPSKGKKAKKEKAMKKCFRCNTELPTLKMLKPTTFYRDKDVLLPNEIRDWLSAINDEDLMELGFDPLYSRPEWMVLTVLPVPPVNVRPSITLETGERSEDDLTHKLVDIIRINQKLESNINAGAPQLIIEDLWELLQYHVTTYFDNETANIPPARHRSGRPLKTLAQRLKGKEGRFRYNLSGKRVNFSARTVISPDPNLRIDEVGIPKSIAEELTIPMAVTEWNLEKCKSFILAPEYPRALYIIRPDGRRLKVGDTDEAKKEMIENLKVGWILERHLMDGDIALFNRQPSLHRISMMAHEVRVLPGRTFRLNPTTISPYNADFDGDEMNLHILQTEEAQSEARYLMQVNKQILSPRHGHAIIKPQEDHVSGLYFLTKDQRDFTREEAADLLYQIGIYDLPKPDRKDHYSGKLLFSQLLPKELNLRIKSKLGGDIIIKNGELVKGAVESRAIESDILESIFIQKGPEFASDFLNKVTRLALTSITRHGMTVSLQDYTLSPKAQEEVRKMLDNMNRQIDTFILQYKNKTLERSPGLSLKETLERMIVQITSETREAAGRLVERDLTIENSGILMAKIGARGSLLNATQMAAVVAQQTVRNKRIKRGYKGRTLPYFRRGELTAKERGFVFSSFQHGLTPYEFIHHAMGGREALVNTAIRTARSGYMQRRLINALQDLVVHPDFTVRNSDMSIIQFVYGG
ncbi:MAG TPA: DNA-directed RNA polymerase subunit A', partial [Candidatus Bilamarchaeaceae archaeon]|nr:DNA-directed RNA polymerase subunit A' [Candidatus Bilamarchaeaceae archaeon]